MFSCHLWSFVEIIGWLCVYVMGTMLWGLIDRICMDLYNVRIQ